ncbi:MAG: hypothetical protein QHC90_01990 [Shinella sp.]|nr:hypothetical protein [Shinella sp.]
MKQYLVTIAVLGALPAVSASAAMNTDPDWPCIQRKVPELSIGQVWNGELTASAEDWDKDSKLADLASELVQRSNPIENARKQIADYAASLPKEKANEKLTQLFYGIFHKINLERDQVISGITRYASKQRQLASDLRAKASEIDKLRAQPSADAADVERQSEQLTWETRIFEERVQSLTYVCEVPTLIEQRLYSLSKIIGEMLGKS